MHSNCLSRHFALTKGELSEFGFRRLLQENCCFSLAAFAPLNPVDLIFSTSMTSDPSNPSSYTLNLSSDSMDVPAMVAGANSRSSSVSSSGPRVRKSRKESSRERIPIPKAIVPAHQPGRSSRDIEMGPSTPLSTPEVQGSLHQSTTQELHLHDNRTSSSMTQVLHQHDNRTQAVHLGISHQEFGSVVAEAQRLLDDSRARADHFEGVAQTIHNQACEQIVHLKSMVESLYQSCQSKDLTINGLSSDLATLQNEVLLVRGQLEAQVTKCVTGERIIGHKDSEIQRLMNEVSSLKQSLDLSQNVRTQLQARLAASSATHNVPVAVEEEAPIPVRQPVQQVVSETSNSNQAILEAIQSLSIQMVGLSNRVDEVEQGRPSSSAHLHSRNDAGASSKSSKELPIPSKHPFPRSLRNPFWDDPGDDGDGEDGGDGEEELIQDGSPTTEREIVDSRSLQHARLDPMPSSAADFRSWKNSLILLLGRMDISNSDYLMTWISHAFKINSAEYCSNSSELVPRLDRWLASELIKGLKGVPDLQFKVQGYIERCTRNGTAPRGRAVLQMASRHFDLDRVRGSLITSQSIFQVELNGYSISDLQDFSSQVMKVLNSIPYEQWPDQRMLGEFLFHKLRTVRRLERVIDEIKRSPDESALRDFDFLWSRLQEFLVEEREDANAKSIEQSLRSPKKTNKDPKDPKPTPKVAGAPAKAVPPKASPTGGDKTSPALVADPKSNPKGKGDKGKGKGKSKAPLTAEEKAKTPCIFFQMPSGCVHGDNCQYSHAKSGDPKNANPKKNDKDGKAKAKAKADAKAKPSVAAAVAILAASVLGGANGFEFAADTGAGRHLISRESLLRQGASAWDFDQNIRRAGESLKFHTGGGTMNSSDSIGLCDDIFGKSNHFILDGCPFVRSVGVDVQENGFGFVWLPGQLPFYVRDPSSCSLTCQESNKIYASRIAENVPFFRSNFNMIPGLPLVPDEGPEEHEVSLEEQILGDQGGHEVEAQGGQGVEAVDINPIPRLPERAVAAREDALSIEHRMTHLPKNALCDVCNRARLYSKRIRSHRVADPEEDIEEPEKFGEQVACDHVIVFKSSTKDKEYAVFIVRDSYSGVMQAYPTVTKSSEHAADSLRHFTGRLADQPNCICKSDCARELLKAIRSLGWLSDASLPRRWPHNSVLERSIRTYQEVCRSLHLQAGFACHHPLWQVTCEYAAISLSRDKWHTAFDKEWKGPDYILGQLVFYRTKFQEKFKLSPNASPGLFGGWKIEFGFRYQGTCKVIDYEALKNGKLSVMLVPDREIYVREDVVFPLCELAEKALKEFSDADVEDLGGIDSLPIPFVDDVPEIQSKSRRVYITYRRILEIGSTPGCRGCEGDSSNHSNACVARFEEAFGRAVLQPQGSAELEDVQDEIIPPEAVSDYSPSIGPRDPLSDDLVPECPLPGESDDDEGLINEVTSGVAVAASVACDAASLLPQEHVQELFQESFDQGGVTSCFGAAANPEVKKPKHGKGKHKLVGKDVLFEFACSKDSNLGKVGQECGVRVIRLCKEDIDLEDPQSIDQLASQVDASKGCSIHCSIECKPWSQWQHLNKSKHPHLTARIRKEQEDSAALVEQFIRIANICLDNGGECSFEWPRFCTGWALPAIQAWILERNLHSATFNGCTVGVEADGQPAKKPWRFLTSSMRLAQNLAALKCTHDKHTPLQGKWTRMSAFYPRPLCQLMMSSMFPHVVDRHVFSMPCVARSHQPHRQKLVKGYPSIPLDILMAETGCHEIHTPAFVHKLLDRSEWKGHPAALKAVENEKQGLLANGTWDESKIRPKSEILAEARVSDKKIHIGSLMSIVSIKGYEKPCDQWVVKARIVFRGDCVRDQENNAAVFDELSSSAPTTLSGLNVVITYGLLQNHKVSTSDAVKAYVQSTLSSSQQTYVQLPYELIPPHAREMKQPCAPLVKSLYGHPLASASWQLHLARILSGDLQGTEIEHLPSCYWFPGLKLALSVYVDDFTLSGPAESHEKFWGILREKVQLEDPLPLDKVLGRGHCHHEGGLALTSSDFARQCVSLYEELSQKPVKHFRTPHVDEGTLVATDEADKGQLSCVAAKLVMKYMWLGRICRPDLLVAINTCAGHITRWTVNDDRRMSRLAGYTAATLHHSHVMHIRDPPSQLQLSLYADADFASGPDLKSTSGFVLALEGPASFALLSWNAKRQRAVSRSTTEAEFVSLSGALFNEAIPLLQVVQLMFSGSMSLRCFEDNQAVLAILAKGYSPKLRHLSKFHRVNVASTCQAFDEPDIEAQYIDTKLQRADIMTKPLSVGQWASALDLLHIIDLKPS